MQENGILRALNFKFSWGSMPPNPPSLVGVNHSYKILDPPLDLYRCPFQIRMGGALEIENSSLVGGGL